MSMKYIRDYYGVPAKRGGRIRFTGYCTSSLGTITSSSGKWLRVRFDGESRTSLVHPAHSVEYLSPTCMEGE